MSTPFTHWLSQHSWLLGSLAAGSVILLVVSVLATPWIVAQLPADYLLGNESRSSRHPILKLTITLMRTLLGAILVVMGLVMLVIPGPGLITLIVGLSLTQFPGKQRLICYIASRKSVFSSLNWMRQRHGKGPLIHPYDRNSQP